MRPAFILCALAAFAVARPLESYTDTTDVALNADIADILNNWDSVVEEAYQEWVDEHDAATVAEAIDFNILGALKKGASAVKTAVVTHATNAAKAGLAAAKTAAKDALKNVASSALTAAHDHLQGAIAGAGADASAEADPAA